MTTTTSPDPAALEAERARIRSAHLKPTGKRPASTARGLHHTALISSDVERTVRFYQDVLGFPLTELIENRDYPGSSHFFFDIGNGNLVAFLTSPAWTSAPTPRSSAGCTTWRSASTPSVGRSWCSG
jgi:hypothetical protein